MTSSSAASPKALSKIACNRLQKELVEWQVNPPFGFKHRLADNLQRWVIDVNGASGTLYANETYQLQVDFPEHYPMEAPQVIFLSPAPLHPHIYSNGHICLDILYDSWSPAMTVGSICISILSMLSSSTAKVQCLHQFSCSSFFPFSELAVLFSSRRDGPLMHSGFVCGNVLLTMIAM